MRVDPVGIDGGDVNLFNYSFSNPVIYIDPYGLITNSMNPSAFVNPSSDAGGLTVEKCCGMTSDMPNDSVMTGLQCMRKCLKTDIHISSGWRSEAQNKNTSGAAKNSYHTQGIAADVHTPPSTDKIRKAAEECGFYVLPKQYSAWVHIDLRDGRSPKSDPDECNCKKIREGE